MHGCHGVLRLLKLVATTAHWTCVDCCVDHVQLVTVVASTQSGHGRTGRRRFDLAAGLASRDGVR